MRCAGVVRLFIFLSLAAAAAALPAQPTPASLETPAPALKLFERDWVLMNWALKFHDTNRDVLIQRDEAEAASAAFRNLADADKDGRITPDEYRSARQKILLGS